MPLEGRSARFNADGVGDIGDYIHGPVYLVTMGSVAAGTADANLNVASRLTYADN